MPRLSHSAQRVLIRVSYLLPAAVGLIFLIHAAIPHLYFIHEAEAHETLSLFALVQNAYSDCNVILKGASEVSNYAIVFSYVVLFCAVAFWVCLVLYWIMALSAAIASTVAFTYPPTSVQANRAKRWFRLFCPNRALYCISHLLLPICAAFPQILLYCYRHQLGYLGMTLHFFGPSDLILVVILILLSLTSHLLLLSAQSEEHMDLYRLYKAKKS